MVFNIAYERATASVVVVGLGMIFLALAQPA